MEIERFNVNEVNLGKYGELPVAPVAVTWPPAWLAALTPSPDAPRKVDPVALNLRGWRLPNGVVVCRCCCPKPADAVPLLLAEGDDGPEWVEGPASTPSPAITSPKAVPVPQHSFNEPQWL